MEIMLCDIRPGDRVIVTGISDKCRLKGRLREFGMVEETDVCCRYLSPGGSLAALELRGTVIAVRRKDLKGIRARRCV